MVKNIFLIVFLLIDLFCVAQTYPIEIHSDKRIASMQLTAAEYNSWKDNNDYTSDVKRKAIFKEVYKVFKDDFDFIILLLNEDEKPKHLPYGQLYQVSNSIKGIGAYDFDDTASYGSAGKLQAVIQLTERSFLRFGPSLHEIMHRWGNYGLKTEAVQKLGANLSSFNYIPHWGFTGGNENAQLGGFKQSTLVDNGNNSYTVDNFGPFANGGNTVKYSEFELYLMGMLELKDVKPFDMFGEITAWSINGDKHTFTANKKTTYTPEILKSLLGERVPNMQNSQKNFKVLVLVLTDTPLTDYQWTIVDISAVNFSKKGDNGLPDDYNFWEATNGKGSLDMENLDKSLISAPKEDTAGGTTGGGTTGGGTTGGDTTGGTMGEETTGGGTTGKDTTGKDTTGKDTTGGDTTGGTTGEETTGGGTTGGDTTGKDTTGGDTTGKDTTGGTTGGGTKDPTEITSINPKESKSNLFIYPNPAYDFIIINFNNVVQSYKIYDVHGKELLSGSEIGDGKVDISDLSKGLYYITTDRGYKASFVKR